MTSFASGAQKEKDLPLATFLKEGNIPTIKIYSASPNDVPIIDEVGLERWLKILLFRLNKLEHESYIPYATYLEVKSMMKLVAERERFGHNGFLLPKKLLDACKDLRREIFDRYEKDNKIISAGAVTLEHIKREKWNISTQMATLILEWILFRKIAGIQAQGHLTKFAGILFLCNMIGNDMDRSGKYRRGRFFDQIALNSRILFAQWRGDMEQLNILKEKKKNIVYKISLGEFTRAGYEFFSFFYLRYGSFIRKPKIRGLVDSIFITRGFSYFDSKRFKVYLSIKGLVFIHDLFRHMTDPLEVKRISLVKEVCMVQRLLEENNRDRKIVFRILSQNRFQELFPEGWEEIKWDNENRTGWNQSMEKMLLSFLCAEKKGVASNFVEPNLSGKDDGKHLVPKQHTKKKLGLYLEALWSGAFLGIVLTHFLTRKRTK